MGNTPRTDPEYFASARQENAGAVAPTLIYHMNAMGHDVPTMIGVDHRGVAKKIPSLIPDYIGGGRARRKLMPKQEVEVAST